MDLPEEGDARVVDEDLEAGEGRKHRLHGGLVGDVAAQRERARARRLDAAHRLARAILVLRIAEGDVAPRARERLADGAADAARAARHKDHAHISRAAAGGRKLE